MSTARNRLEVLAAAMQVAPQDVAIQTFKSLGTDPDWDHKAADEIILEFLDLSYPAVAAEYRRLVDRSRWWATS